MLCMHLGKHNGRASGEAEAGGGLPGGSSAWKGFLHISWPAAGALPAGAQSGAQAARSCPVQSVAGTVCAGLLLNPAFVQAGKRELLSVPSTRVRSC